MSFYARSYLAEARRLSNPFIETQRALEAARSARPSLEYVNPVDPGDVRRPWKGKRVTWEVGGWSTIVALPVHHLLTMEGNLWYPRHAKGVYEAMRAGAVFTPPSGRLYRIDEDDVEDTQEWAAEGELEYQMGMSRPWDPSEAGQFYCQLLNGNHRAVAAMLLGEEVVPFVVGENYREDVTEFDMLR